MPGQIGRVDGSIGGRSGAARSSSGFGRRRAPRGFDVGRVVAVLAPDEVVFADRGDGHELVVHVAAHLARLRLDRPERETAPFEDAVVRVEHLAVALAQRLGVDVERVRVLHQELAAAQQAEAGPELVAVLPVDLVEVHRQVAVRAVLLRDDRGDDLFGRRRQAVRGVLAVVEPEHQVAVLGVATGALPQLERLHDRERDLLGAGPVHLLADDLGDLAQHPRRRAGSQE